LRSPRKLENPCLAQTGRATPCGDPPSPAMPRLAPRRLAAHSLAPPCNAWTRLAWTCQGLHRRAQPCRAQFDDSLVEREIALPCHAPPGHSEPRPASQRRDLPCQDWPRLAHPCPAMSRLAGQWLDSYAGVIRWQEEKKPCLDTPSQATPGRAETCPAAPGHTQPGPARPRRALSFGKSMWQEVPSVRPASVSGRPRQCRNVAGFARGFTAPQAYRRYLTYSLKSVKPVPSIFFRPAQAEVLRAGFPGP
jgi:hypothetical protein